MNREINFFTIAINILVEMWQRFNRFRIIIGFVGNEHMPWCMADKKSKYLLPFFLQIALMVGNPYWSHT
jgi:hypothetical protein